MDNVERGALIAENIRKILLNCDLRIVYAEGELKLANEDYRLYSKKGTTASTRKALRAKARGEAYKVFIKNVTKVKGEVSLGLDRVLSRYTPKYKKIWVMYFLEQANIDDICSEVNYSRANVNVIIKKLKLDLDHHYKGGVVSSAKK